MEPPGLRLVDANRTPDVDAAPDDAPPTSEGMTFTLKSAAKACLVDAQTVRRRAEQLKQHGAVQHPDKSWTIPYRALLAVGLHPGQPSPPDRTPDRTPDHIPDQPKVIAGAAPPGAPAAPGDRF